MSASGYQEIQGFSAEDYTDTITVEGSGSIVGWTLAGKLFDPTGAEVVGAVSVAITDAAARTITMTIAGQNLGATTYYAPYRFEVRRTDAGSRTLVAWGPLSIGDPAAAPPN